MQLGGYARITQAAIYRVTDGVPALQCAGAVLQPGWILTAASCLRRRSEQRLVAAVGETILSGSLADDVPLFTISDDVTVFDYLALVSVSPHPFTPQRDVPKAVCLPDVDSSATLRSLPLTVTGWGATSRLSRRRVRAARVTLLPTAVCRSDTSTQVFIRRPPVVCTLSPRLMTVSQPCVATTGSPLLRLDPSRRRYELVGLLTDATQQGCPQTGHVTYTSVGEYVDIIRLAIALGKQ
ncbi:PREDICTED: transmembrane protease serine 4-like [Priapulus caudatus]|uniref:Transmembrane protease serine 4-like n=1 Tax=Priapulus caudatus TaxID=37621 RepID=A0ABM1EPI3_PRICU|nr:PREDICTED: transmembrane protease serine 4-like [Priapulus caudatus]